MGRQRNGGRARLERLIVSAVPEKDAINCNNRAKNDSNHDAGNDCDCEQCPGAIHHLRHFARTKVHFFLEACAFRPKARLSEAVNAIPPQPTSGRSYRTIRVHQVHECNTGMRNYLQPTTQTVAATASELNQEARRYARSIPRGIGRSATDITLMSAQEGERQMGAARRA
jgi:hypothetical protein